MFRFLSIIDYRASRPTQALLAGLLFAAFATTASAQPGVVNDDGSMTEQVSSVGLDLASPSAQVTMRQRIEMAARRVCGFDDQGDASGRRAYTACHEAAMANAMGQFTTLVARAGGIGSANLEMADTRH
ncbi:UrcA family protein [Lichenicola cladoniae]|uniref:UrcA family protein n=1 Tax=Lichenicola cladoniae TaxID=1484109 RepID=A0A6M8HPY0_9PROT|nr:UrcA family protein [Lichenicola cladoniae]NPD66472.1 UrcA family protein [Acetobacteraceae bacterium]QKE90301.1 UrcA family protein [Lichenicola cladoniae]